MAKLRTAEINRKTNETDITITLSLDGGEISVDTGVGFFDHMLNALARHAGFGLTLRCKGDLQVDAHHTVEDVGITLGQATRNALGETPVTRFGEACIPMDEALAKCVLDISNRPYLVFDATFDSADCGGFDFSLVEEFMRAFAVNAGLTLHIGVTYGRNSHHKAEAMFKALAYALRRAVVPCATVMSTKGVI